MHHYLPNSTKNQKMSPLLTDFDENLSVYRAYQSEENQVSSAGDTRVSKLAVL